MAYDEPEADRPPYHEIGPDDARKLQASGALVVDVRQPGEWRRGHIAGAQLIPLDGIYVFGHAIVDLPHDRDVVFVCEVGQRSGVASEIALVAGFSPDHVHNLMGGMGLWRRQGLPMER